MARHVHADLIHAWAEGAVIQGNAINNNDNSWLTIGNDEMPLWNNDEVKFRIKPKEPEWWENIPDHGILVDFMGLICTVSKDEINSGDINPEECIPLTNEEIERFKR